MEKKIDSETYQKLHFLTLNELVNMSNGYLGDNTSLIICGWFNRLKMFNAILRQNSISNIDLFLYQHEKLWFDYASNNWNNRINRFQTDETLLKSKNFGIFHSNQDLFNKNIRKTYLKN